MVFICKYHLIRLTLAEKKENKTKTIEEQLAEIIERTRIQNDTLKKMIDQIQKKNVISKTSKSKNKKEK